MPPLNRLKDVMRAFRAGSTRAEQMQSAAEALRNLRVNKERWISELGEASYRTTEKQLMSELQGLELHEATDPLGGLAQELKQAKGVTIDPKNKYKVSFTDPSAISQAAARVRRPESIDPSLWDRVAQMSESETQLELARLYKTYDSPRGMGPEDRKLYEAITELHLARIQSPAARAREYGRRVVAARNPREAFEQMGLERFGRVPGSDIQGRIGPTGEVDPGMKLYGAESQAPGVEPRLKVMRGALADMQTILDQMPKEMVQMLQSMDDAELEQLYRQASSPGATPQLKTAAQVADLVRRHRSIADQAYREAGLWGRGPAEEQLGFARTGGGRGGQYDDRARWSLEDWEKLRRARRGIEYEMDGVTNELMYLSDNKNDFIRQQLEKGVGEAEANAAYQAEVDALTNRMTSLSKRLKAVDVATGKNVLSRRFQEKKERYFEERRRRKEREGGAAEVAGQMGPMGMLGQGTYQVLKSGAVTGGIPVEPGVVPVGTRKALGKALDYGVTAATSGEFAAPAVAAQILLDMAASQSTPEAMERRRGRIRDEVLQMMRTVPDRGAVRTRRD